MLNISNCEQKYNMSQIGDNLCPLPKNHQQNIAQFCIKTSKRALNMNAVKFKLTKLRTTQIRYEVIYKNLVRDLRKFYSKDFNDETDYIKKKKSMPN
jgi:hypothetical protein